MGRIPVLLVWLSVGTVLVDCLSLDPFYEVLSSQQDVFHANFCLTAPQDLHGWKIRVGFDKPVATMQIRRAEVMHRSADQFEYHVVDQSWNARWLSGERNCFDFHGSGSSLNPGAVATTLQFAGIVEPSGCPGQIAGQQFSLTVVKHWRNGLSGSVCLTVPRDADWKIRAELDRRILRLTSPDADVYNARDRLHWILTPHPSNRQLSEAATFCLDFTAFTRQLINPCIRAFFTEADGKTPIVSGVTTTPAAATSGPTSTATGQSATTTTSAQSQATATSTQPPPPPTTTTTGQTTTSPGSSSSQSATTTTSGQSQATTTTTTTTTTQPPPPPTTTGQTTMSPGSSSSDFGGTSTIISLWDAGINARLCLSHSVDVTCGWEIDVRFDPAVTRLDIWSGQTTGTVTDGAANVYHVVSHSWSGALPNNPACFEFNAYKNFNHAPQISGRFTRICSNNQWQDITGGSGSNPVLTTTSSTTSSQTTAAATSPGGGGNQGSNPTTTAQPTPSPTTPQVTGNVNQEMLDLYSSTFSGDGTYYGEGREGTCTYDQTNFPAVGLSNQIHALAALNYIKWYNSKACGMCFKVTGQGVGLGADPLDGEYIVFIKDLCPQGACSFPGSVDFAENKDGRWDIDIQAVQCPVGNNKLQYAFQGSNPWYIKLQVSNYRIPPNEVSLYRNGQWKEMTKSSDGYWLLTDGEEMTNTMDIPVKVTAINGEQLADTIPQLQSTSVVMDGGQRVQFSLDPNLPSLP